MKRTREDRLSHAKRLYLEGKPLKQIAQLSTTKVDTIEYWAKKYQWKAERERLKLAQLEEKLPGMREIDELRLKGAYALYAASVETRLELVRRWVQNRRPSDTFTLNSLGYGDAKYIPASSLERASFCNEVKAINDLISGSREELDRLRSTLQDNPDAVPLAVVSMEDIQRDANLRCPD